MVMTMSQFLKALKFLLLPSDETVSGHSFAAPGGFGCVAVVHDEVEAVPGEVGRH
jgi:hypothetical protein